MSPSEKAIRYAKDVISGAKPNCLWVRLASQRFLDDLARQRTDGFPYFFDTTAADKVVRFYEMLPHIKGSKWAGRGLKMALEDWQCFTECNIFGWKRCDNNKRRFRLTYERIPRKNGKSMKAACRGLYMLCCDGEHGAEIYAGATTEKQAFEVYKPAWLMVQKLPELRDHFGVELTGNAKNPGAMYVLDDLSKFETVIGNPGDGASPHMAIVDEYHEHDSDALVDTMQTGMGAREQPLLSIVTTAGSNLGGPCYALEQDMQNILKRSSVDETVFAVMWGLDDKDAWDDPENLKKANPNYGVSIFPEFLLAQLAQAKRTASKQNSFRTKHLNEWVGAKTAWMNMSAWARQTKKMNMEEFKSCPCRVSVDLSSKKDAVAIDITFKKDEHFYSFKKFFCPDETVLENDKYQEFLTSGELETTEGAMTDYETVENYLIELAKNFNVLDFSFDEWQADYMMVRLAKINIKVIKYPIRVKFITDPMKTLEALVLDGRYWHDGNKMNTWMFGNVSSKEDIRGNVFPNKASKDERCKIDGAVTAIMSIGRWFAEEEPEKEYKIFFAG